MSAVKAAATHSSPRRRRRSRRRRRRSKRYRDGHRTTCAFNSLHTNDAFFPRDEKTKRIEFKTPSTPSRPKTTRRSSFLSSSSLVFVVVRPTNVVVKVVLRVLVRADDSLPERRGRCRNDHHYQNVSRGMAVHVVRDRTENERSETVFFTPRSRGYFEREQQRFRSASKKCV